MFDFLLYHNLFFCNFLVNKICADSTVEEEAETSVPDCVRCSLKEQQREEAFVPARSGLLRAVNPRRRRRQACMKVSEKRRRRRRRRRRQLY
jgi:hypothetical protein